MTLKNTKIHYGLLFVPLILAIGCSDPKENKEDSEVFTINDPVEPIVLKSAVKVLDEQEASGFFSNTIGNQPPAVIDAASLDNASFVVGQTPDSEGFLSKVVGTRVVDGKTVADLEPATIDEVIQDGDWKYQIPAATEAEVEAEPFATDEALIPDYNLQPESLNLKTISPVFKINLAGKSLSAPSTQVGNFSVSIDEGTLTYAPSVTIGGQHRNGRITEFSFLSQGTMTVRMKISANLTKGVSKGVSPVGFPAIKKPFAFMIGAVPVAGTINFDVGGGMSLSSGVSGKLQTGITCTFPITAGGKFVNGKWQKVSSPAITCTADRLTSSAQANAGVKVSLQPELSVRLYGVVGPAVDLEPYLSANTTFKPSPRTCNYNVKAGVSSTFSVAAKLFKWTATAYSATLFDQSKVLKSGTFCN